MPDDASNSTANPLKPSPAAKNEPIQQQDPKEALQQLQDAIDNSNDVLMSATTVMTLFPDTVTVDRAKFTVLKRTFFRSAQVMSINVEDILNATATVGPLFGTVRVVSRTMGLTDKPYTAALFWRKDAIKLKRILQGYIIALQRSIDCSTIPTEELVIMLEQLGEDDHPNQ